MMPNRASKTQINNNYKLILLFLSAFILVLSITPRFLDIAKTLPDYSIDENDVVEPAIAFMGGDLKPYWYSYGPLYSYLLSGINLVIMKIQGLSFFEYTSKIFFEPISFYLIARWCNSVLI